MMNNNTSSCNIEKQKVVVIQTSSIDDGLKWLRNTNNGLSLNHGDELIILGILHYIPTTPSSSISFNSAAAKLLGNKDKEENYNRVFDSTRKIVEEEVKRKKEDYEKNDGILQLQKMYQIEKKVRVSIDVEAGKSRKVAAIRAVNRLDATWIILDREMKKEKQYFMDRLSCGISRMKSNHTIVQIRGPINEHVSYDEMIPSYSWEQQQLVSLTLLTHKSPAAGEIQYCSSSTTTTSLVNGCQKHYSMNTKQTQASYCTKLVKTPSLGQILHIATTDQGDRKGIIISNAHNVDEDQEFQNSICSLCKNRRPKIGLQRDFSYTEIYEATNGFSRENFLSEGGFGFVFRGRLKDGVKIAVKQHKVASLQGEKEFKCEVDVLSQARHENLVMLLGSCTEDSHKLLVYEYVCNGSLEKHLSADEISVPPLNWQKRIRIALGAAKGLEYLHAHNIVHRDMRPSNILITHDHESLLGDFGLAKAQKDDTSAERSDSGVVGTLGYMAPEYAESGKISTKTDVYSFGVVLLQLITGLKTTDTIPEGKSLVGWAKPLLETKNYPDLIDKRIVESHDVHQLFWMVRVAEDCLKTDPKKRCTMKMVVHNLNCIRQGNTNFIRDF